MNNSLINDMRGFARGTIKQPPADIIARMAKALFDIDDALYEQADDMIETITEILRKPR